MAFFKHRNLKKAPKKRGHVYIFMNGTMFRYQYSWKDDVGRFIFNTLAILFLATVATLYYLGKYHV